MGNSASKAARKFPTKVPDASKVYRPVKDLGEYAANAPELQNRPPPHIQGERNQDVERDGQDPQFLQMLKKHGPVKYDNAAVTKQVRNDDPMKTMFEARSRLQKENDDLEANPDAEALRQTLEVSEIIGILNARKSGISDVEIKQRFKLAPGVLERLGASFNTTTEVGEPSEAGFTKSVWQ